MKNINNMIIVFNIFIQENIQRINNINCSINTFYNSYKLWININKPYLQIINKQQFKESMYISCYKEYFILL